MTKTPHMSNCQLYERMDDYVHKHLTKPRVKVETYDSGSGGDKLTLSLLNLTVIMWLRKVDPQLINKRE